MGWETAEGWPCQGVNIHARGGGQLALQTGSNMPLKHPTHQVGSSQKAPEKKGQTKKNQACNAPPEHPTPPNHQFSCGRTQSAPTRPPHLRGWVVVLWKSACFLIIRWRESQTQMRSPELSTGHLLFHCGCRPPGA